MTYLYRNYSLEKETNNLSSNNQVVNDPLAIIYNENFWRVFKLSPLYNFKCDKGKLKSYASKIKQNLVSALPASSLKYTVTFEELPTLKYSEEDPSGLVITVTVTDDSNKENKTSYSAILLSWGIGETLERGIHLPYMLERGEQKVGYAVRTGLQNLFDCNIKQFNFTQYQLLQFGFSFVDCDTSRNTDPFSFVYTTPQVDKDKLTMSFEIGDIHSIWNSVKEEDHRLGDQTKMAYHILQNHIFDTIMLDITVFDLCEIKTPKAEVKIHGVVKMKTAEMVNGFFTLLNDINCFYEKAMPIDED